MAIQMRRGEYDDFDASKMLAGELAVVVSGDPETEGGALYVATAAGSATRVAFANEIPGDATTTSDGLMSAADKAKLDGIAAGAKKVTITETTRGSGAQVVSFAVQNPDGTFEFPPTAVKADSNGYVDMTSVANGSIPNSKLATPYTLPTMSASAKGGATVGDGLAMTGDALGIADEGVGMGMLSQEVQEAIAEGGGGGGYNPALSVGRADALTGADDTAQWAQRESEGSGSATVRNVQGAAVAWNQLNDNGGTANTTGLTRTNNADGSVTLNGTASSGSIYFSSYFDYTANHKVLVRGCPSGGGGAFEMSMGGVAVDTGEGAIASYGSDATTRLVFTVRSSYTFDNVTIWPQCFDLTAMFGAGNEPQSVAEFERMYPEPYYPYSAPTLTPVRIAGIASTDANGDALDGVEWEAQTLRAAGSVADELTADELVTRVGVVDLGTLNWQYYTSLGGAPAFYSLTQNGSAVSSRTICVSCAALTPITADGLYSTTSDTNIICLTLNGYLQVRHAATTVADFKAAMQGVMCFYTLATSTTTPISPALPMTYRVEQDGTESIVVPEGEISAAPVLTVAEGESAADVVMDALACIATPDGPVATANHSVGTYLTYDGKLYKVTSAIAVGETITAGTNVTATTVMDEILALN